MFFSESISLYSNIFSFEISYFIDIDEIDSLIESGVIYGGMIPKIKSCEKAIRSGVKKAVMIDGRIPHSIIIEMFSKEGIGTLMQGSDKDE